MRVIPSTEVRYMGKPCYKGHSGLRYKVNRACVDCVKEKADERYAKGLSKTPKAQSLEKKKAWRALNRPAAALRYVLKEFIKRAKLQKYGRSTDLVGYTAEELRCRMQELFVSGMTWENYGEWHIDHKKPVSKFLEEGVTNPKIVNALSNLQPLWKRDNLSKANKILQGV